MQPTTWEPHPIDSVSQETRCEGCGCPLSCGDVAVLNTNTFTVACSPECGDHHDANVRRWFAELRTASIS